MTPEQARPESAAPRKRRGVVIVAVLVVVVILLLAGYQYTDMMTAEYRASENAHRVLQARALADSGIHYATGLLADDTNFNTVLNGNFWNNSAFQNIEIMDAGGSKVIGKCSIICPTDPDDPGTTASTVQYGVIDESSKINLNALMVLDPTGQTLYGMLMLLPNMTDPIACSIVNWMMPSTGTPMPDGQTDYSSMGYQIKNGPIDSIDELMLVSGVTWQLLYGADTNRNGTQDQPPTDLSGTATVTPPANNFDRGWSAYLTVHSREQNYDYTGNPYVFVNNPSMAQLNQLLQQQTELDSSLATFIQMYRQYGPASGATGKSQSLAATIVSLFSKGSSNSSNSTSTSTKQGNVANYQVDTTKPGKYTITSLWQLVNASVSIQSTDPNTKKTITTSYASPLNDASQQATLLPQLFMYCTLAPGNEMPARINVNTAPSTVLTTLTGIPNSPLTTNDVANIIQTRPTLTTTGPANPIFQTPAWLYTQAKIKLSTLQQLDPYITTRAQVFRIQAVGYFDGKGPTARMEAVIDTNMQGRPRILMSRPLGELGKGWDINQLTNDGSSANP